MKFSQSLGYMSVDLNRKNEFSIEFIDAFLVTDPWTDDTWWTQKCGVITADNVG
jgi:hypothetical protein